MAKNSEWWKISHRIETQKEYCKKVFSYCNLDESSGIYVFYRVDKLGQKKCYVGQAKHLLTRVNEHVNSTRFEQHIDKSIYTHGIASKKNFGGWKLRIYKCAENELNEKEKFYIQFYLNHNYELYNIESGGQDKGHSDINTRKERKGYSSGVKIGENRGLEKGEKVGIKKGLKLGLDQGYKKAITEIADLFKYIKVVPNQFKKNGEPTALALKKVIELQEKIK